jgi:SAM-dependent methyltransferase
VPFNATEIQQLPVNVQQRDTSEQAIKEAADYAFVVGKSNKEKCEMWAGPLAGKVALEIGPGVDFGSTLFMACFGATIATADHWLADWQDDFHRPLYSLLAENISAAYPEADLTPLTKTIHAGRYLPEVITLIPEMADHMAGVADETFDYVVSNAVFEHIPNLQGAAARLAEITKRGGLHIHQVDMRDHRWFDRPLEYLLLSADEEAEYLRLSDYHLGALRRAPEYEAAFRDAGFKVLSNYVNLRAEPDYMDDLMGRLRQVADARYRDWPREDLEILGVTYAFERA